MFSKRDLRSLLSIFSAVSFWFVPLHSAHAATKVASPATDATLQTNVSKPKQTDRLFMWKVSSGEKELYLVGSIHMVPANFYPLPAGMEKAFDKSNVLVLEIDESKEDPQATQMYAMKAGVYLDGDSITNHITKDTAAEFQKWIAKCDPMTAMSLQRMKPWFASLMIPISELQKRGFDPKKGIDKHFMEQAQAQKKGIDELESSEFQLKLLSGFSEDLQDKLLMSSLVDAANTDRDATDMVNAWKTGDADLMDAVVTRDEKQHPELKPVMEKLLYDRNVGMAEKIAEYLKSGKQYFVVVGAGHLVGPRGLVALLKQKGFTVEQVTAIN